MQIDIHFLYCCACEVTLVITDTLIAVLTYLLSYLLKQEPSINLIPEVDFWLYGRHLEKSIWPHNPAMDRLITTKFGRLTKNHMPTTLKTFSAMPTYH